MKIILPFKNPKNYPLTQRFGVSYIYNGAIAYHKGIDYALPNFTDIIAPFDGTVVKTTPERDYGYGKAVYLKAKDGKMGKLVALMAHMDNITVHPGYKMKQGQSLGRSGRSGFWRGKNGYHVHFGLCLNDKYVDPLPIMKVKQEQDSSLFDEDDSKLKDWEGSHTVVPGDTLWRMSQKYYGHGGHFMEIFNANVEQLNSPNLINPGMILRIPAVKDKGI